MSLTSFEAATHLWLELADSETDDEAYFHAERLILDHRPRHDHEAVLIAEVLAESLAGGERSDGRDVLAARNLQLWMGRSLTGEVVPVAARTLARVAARVVA